MNHRFYAVGEFTERCRTPVLVRGGRAVTAIATESNVFSPEPVEKARPKPAYSASQV